MCDLDLTVREFIKKYEKNNETWGFQIVAQLLKCTILEEGRFPDIMFDNETLEDYPLLADYALGVELIDTEYDEGIDSLFPTIVVSAVHHNDLIPEDEEIGINED